MTESTNTSVEDLNPIVNAKAQQKRDSIMNELYNDISSSDDEDDAGKGEGEGEDEKEDVKTPPSTSSSSEGSNSSRVGGKQTPPLV